MTKANRSYRSEAEKGSLGSSSYTSHMSHQSEPEKTEILNYPSYIKKEKKENKPVSFFQLYRFTSAGERVCLFVGFLATLVASVGLPAINTLFSVMESLMIKQGKDESLFSCNETARAAKQSTSHDGGLSNDEFLSRMGMYALYMLAFGALELIAGYFFISIFKRVAEHQIYRLRTLYLHSLLRQNVGWYDTVEETNFVSKISENLSKVQEATGEKVGQFLYYILTALISLVVAFWFGWLLTLVVLSVAPLVLATTVTMFQLQGKYAMEEGAQSAESGKVSEEVFDNIRTVKVFSGQEKEIQRYESALIKAMTAAKKRGVVSALGNCALWVFNYGGYALAFWYGTKLVFDGRFCDPNTGIHKHTEYGPANLLVVFYSILVLLFHIVEAMALMETFSIGRAAAAAIYYVIDRNPEIDSFADTGIIPRGRPRGKIEFRDLQFSYPNRPDVPILRGLNLKISPGSTVAFVGSSGCGKSTTLQLLQRFYDPTSGAILLDDVDIQDLNITWYRSQLGVVSQEPVLFSTTIAENIRYGQEGAGQDDIENACKLANAHAFISKLPDKYDTLVGDRGAQLSGGQKQRIAIARALVRNPSVLILDEATSALDTRNESIVQHALDTAKVGRTTLIVAHRLSTIRTADVIVSIQNGQIMETGTHQELLLNEGGVYFNLVTAQMGGTDQLFSIGDHANFDDPNRDDTQPSKLSSATSRSNTESIESIFYKSGDSQHKISTDEEYVDRCTTFRILKLNRPECPLLIIGAIFSIAHGCSLPAYAFFFGDFMGVFSIKDRTEAQDTVNFYALLFLITGVVAGITILVASICYTLALENLTNRLRILIFKKLVYLDVAWFDSPTNSVGALCTRLSADTSSIQGATGSRLGTVVQSITTISVSTGISLYILPKLGLITLGFLPIILITSYVSDKTIQKQQTEEKLAFEDSSKLAFQAVSNIRTVASLSKEQTFVTMYSEALLKPHKKALRNSHLSGIVYGLAESVVYCAYAAVYYYGGYLIVTENEPAEKVLIIGEAMLWSMLTIGKALSFGPSFNVAKVSGARILKLLESKQGVSKQKEGDGLQLDSFRGNIDFEEVEFSYPSRPDVKILRGLTADINAHSTVGICGPSGSGKSTCIQLLLRFYDPTSGQILLDNNDMRSLNVNSCLSQMALVSQEPALFDRTIAENIAYGDNSRDLSMTEIISAAKSANIHDFINTLPEGYLTRVGEMGAQLSGGQKQRVAIARALVRNPKLLLLDEATSALDMESEKVVQDALDMIMTDNERTSISIAHRLSSIQHADKILVVNHGKLVEGGTHAELISKRGMYYTLWNMQSHGYTHTE